VKALSKLTKPRAAAPAIALAVLALVGATLATGAMRSERLAPRLCETKGGGRFVAIPGSPGEFIDRRLLNDVRMLKRKYKILITDGYSLDPVHARNGEHPIGLALDIVPDRARGGNWRLITKLAKWAEPKQNQPRPPFRWGGYNGDPGHGRGNHLHLSWSHSETSYNVPARTVYTVRCPTPRKPKADDPKQPPKPKGGGGGGASKAPAPKHSNSTGGISVRAIGSALAPIHPETGGVSLHRRR